MLKASRIRRAHVSLISSRNAKFIDPERSSVSYKATSIVRTTSPTNFLEIHPLLQISRPKNLTHHPDNLPTLDRSRSPLRHPFPSPMAQPSPLPHKPPKKPRLGSAHGHGLQQCRRVGPPNPALNTPSPLSFLRSPTDNPQRSRKKSSARLHRARRREPQFNFRAHGRGDLHIPTKGTHCDRVRIERI
ncbi:hypothetical protein H4Q26_002368 [Puccinia striiformis f. sp. tritici PST-130]|nr:hypothetical protein H4Q26_002368 [Puccinia striiformis f. sp. tritici PST-130]